jgi:hypothetical protein
MHILLLVWKLYTVRHVLALIQDLSKSYLLTSAGWGVVGAVVNNYMIVTAFHPFSFAAHPAGSWMIVRAQPYHTTEFYPLGSSLVFSLFNEKMRTWSITLDECPVIDSSSTVGNPIQYVGYDFTRSYTSFFKFARRKNYSIKPEVNLKFVNSEPFSKNISHFWDPYAMQSEVNVSLFDSGSSVS